MTRTASTESTLNGRSAPLAAWNGDSLFAIRQRLSMATGKNPAMDTLAHLYGMIQEAGQRTQQGDITPYPRVMGQRRTRRGFLLAFEFPKHEFAVSVDIAWPAHGGELDSTECNHLWQKVTQVIINHERDSYLLRGNAASIFAEAILAMWNAKNQAYAINRLGPSRRS